MSEETPNVAEEISQEETVQPQEEQSSPSQDESAPEVPTMSDKEMNFARLRKSKEQLESKVQELEADIQGMKAPQKEEPPEEDFGIEDEDLAEGKHLKKLYRELNTLKKAYEQDKIAIVPDRLKTKFADFDEVVSRENVEKLKQDEPELYSMITAGSDLYAKGVSAYKTLKNLGYANENYTEQKEQISNNQKRPVSAQAIKGQGALSDSNIFAKGLTPELKKQLLKEMVEAAKAS